MSESDEPIVPRMKRIQRDPVRDDVFSAFVSAKDVTDVHDATDVEDFLALARAAITESLESPHVIHGYRAQAMFEAISLELGRIRMVRLEDAGSGWHDFGDIQIPDYRLVLEDGSQLLVEVKNHYGSSVASAMRYKFRKYSYVEGLRRYGELLNTRVMIAIYWANLGLWTLNDLSEVKSADTKGILTLEDAMKMNEMAMLGDYMVATKFPLQARMYFDGATENYNEVQKGTRTFAMYFTGIRFWCGDREITSEQEQSLALNLMWFGKWKETESPEFDEGGKPVSILYECNPEGEHRNDFAILGFISQMSSKGFLMSTQRGSKVPTIRGAFTPGLWRRLIPDVYKHSDTLPLWLFKIRANRGSGEAKA